MEKQKICRMCRSKVSHPCLHFSLSMAFFISRLKHGCVCGKKTMKHCMFNAVIWSLAREVKLAYQTVSFELAKEHARHAHRSKQSILRKSIHSCLEWIKCKRSCSLVINQTRTIILNFQTNPKIYGAGTHYSLQIKEVIFTSMSHFATRFLTWINHNYFKKTKVKRIGWPAAGNVDISQRSKQEAKNKFATTTMINLDVS